MADASARTAVLEGFPLSITIVISAFLVFAILSVGVRSYVRVVDNVFGVDDGLMLAGLVCSSGFTKHFPAWLRKADLVI